MADAAAPAPAKGGAIAGWMKTAMGGTVGLVGGVATMYATAVFDQVVKPAKPMANFQTKADGLTVTCESRANGQSGWWDFGDGSALEPFTSEQPTVTHTYNKPGNYNVKLTVRNFLAEENDRTVPVEVGATAVASANTSAATGPVATLTVVPITPNPTVPATFRITGQVQNADKSFIDVVPPSGTQVAAAAAPNRINVTPSGGVIDTLIVVDKPGQHAIQLFGTKGNDVVKQTAYVSVAAPSDGSVSARLRVIDTGTKVDSKSKVETVAVLIPSKAVNSKTVEKSFEKLLTSLPGYLIQDVKIKSAASKLASNIKLTPSADKQTCKLTGDWAGNPDQLAKLAGGSSDMMVMVEMTCIKEEKIVQPTNVTVRLNGSTGTGTLPPQPIALANAQRQIELDLCVYRATGDRTVMASCIVIPGQPMRKPIDYAGQRYNLDVNVAGQQVTVSLTK